MRVGIGYDVHPLTLGRKLILGGIDIPFDKGLAGHSDADVLTHAITDALLGAAGLKDIGSHFPSEDESYKDISSLVLLGKAYEIVTQKGYKIGNIDAIVVAQQPKLAPYIDGMRRRLGQALGIEKERLMVKATTTEGLCFAGRGEGVAAYAVVLLDGDSQI